MEWSELLWGMLPFVLLPFALVGLFALIHGWNVEGFWWVARSRYRRLAENFLVCEEREGYVWHLLSEAEANHTDQTLHWWAWLQLYRTFGVPREERAHDAHSSPGPTSGDVPLVVTLADAPDPGSSSGGRFDFPV